MGIGDEKMPVQWASSAVFAIVNTQRRAVARGAAVTYLAWDRVSEMADVKADDGTCGQGQVRAKSRLARTSKRPTKRAYQHVMYLDLGDESSGEPRVDKTITFEHENQTSLDGTTVWKALVEAEKAFDLGTFNAKALLHNLRDRPTTTSRWTKCATSSGAHLGCPCFRAVKHDLQRAIYEGIGVGTIRLVGSDGADREVNNPSEIGVGNSTVRLATPLPQTDPTAPDDIVEPTNDDPDPRPHDDPKRPTPQPPSPTAKEKQLTFTLRTSLTGDHARDALYEFVQRLADSIDAGHSSYAEVMLKLRLDENTADDLAELAKETTANVDLREV